MAVILLKIIQWLCPECNKLSYTHYVPIENLGETVAIRIGLLTEQGAVMSGPMKIPEFVECEFCKEEFEVSYLVDDTQPLELDD